MSQPGEAGFEIGGKAAAPDPGFAARMKAAAGTDLWRCYQCMTCTLGCPVAHHMDVPPHRLVRWIQMGLKDEAFACRTLQICVSCETCSSRCPNGIHVDRLVDALRIEALREGRPAAIPAIRTFHKAFLSGIRARGKVFELGMIMRLKLATLNLFQDAFAGMRMFFKGKIHPIPHGIEKREEVRKIFDETIDRKR
ncbi:MAG: 4Fe-4S dicluster domain-containing protein [Planctomycetes bacterium]|jgi:heterodisulfide reductase subunit C|nr:4Fe-4S dicluster domain-containing protein [Planctomycetota bacterium]